MRAIREAELEFMRAAVRHYVELAAHHAKLVQSIGEHAR
jgi:hypothetical protein